MSKWVVSGSPNLPIYNKSVEWDGQRAVDSIFKWATDSNGNVDVSKVKKGFVFSDAESDGTLRKNYKEPFAMVFDGKLYAVPDGVRAAKRRLHQVKDISEDTRKKAEKFLDDYMEKIRKKQKETNFTIKPSIVENLTEASGDYRWKIRIIQAGMSDNLRLYTPEVLQEAAPLFEGVKSFANHFYPDVKDVVGKITDVEFKDDALYGVYNGLKTHWLNQRIAEAMERGWTDMFEFSIRASGEVEPTELDDGSVVLLVKEINKVYSVDVVVFAAAGGGFVEGIESKSEENVTKETEVREETKEEVKEKSETKEEQYMSEEVLKQVEEMKEKLAAELRELTIQRALAKAELSEAQEKLVCKLLEGKKELTADDVTEAIATVVDAMPKPEPGVKVTEDASDKKMKLVEASIIGERVDGIDPLNSITQLYAAVTGDTSIFRLRNDVAARKILGEMGGYDPDLLESSTFNWSHAIGDAINRAIDKEYRGAGYDSWRLIVSDVVNLKDMKTQHRVLVTELAELPVVNKGADYQPFTQQSDTEETYTPVKRGGLITIDWEDLLNDDLGAFRRIPRIVGRSGAFTVHKTVFGFLESNPAMSDGVKLFDTTDNGTGGYNNAHNNVFKANLSYDTLKSMWTAMKAQPRPGTAVPIMLIPKYLVVPSELETTAEELRLADHSANDLSKPNIFKEKFEVIEVPYFTDTDASYLVADPKSAPTIEVGFLNGRDVPVIYTENPSAGSSFVSDVITYKVRFVLGAAVLDYRPFAAAIP